MTDTPEDDAEIESPDPEALAPLTGPESQDSFQAVDDYDLDLNVALEKIKKSGLLIGKIDYINSDLKVSSNKVIDQFPYGECRITDKINLTVQK